MLTAIHTSVDVVTAVNLSKHKVRMVKVVGDAVQLAAAGMNLVATK